jgi:hypothetical protein
MLDDALGDKSETIVSILLMSPLVSLESFVASKIEGFRVRLCISSSFISTPILSTLIGSTGFVFILNTEYIY